MAKKLITMSTLKHRLKEAAAQVELTPELSGILQRFFLEHSTRADRNRLDEWINESSANDHFFDLLLELGGDGTGAATIATLRKYTQKPPRKTSRFRKWAWRITGIVLLVLLLDHFMPSHPLSRLVKGRDVQNPSYSKTVVQTAGDTKTLWLPDSSRIVLLPHSSVGFREAVFIDVRSMEFNGSGRFEVRNNTWPLETDLNGWTLKVQQGSFEVASSGDTIRVLSGTATVYIRKNRKEWTLEPGGEARLEKDKPILLPKPQ